MNKIKRFFGIKEQFRVEWGDVNALITLANVGLIIAGFWWAPFIGIAGATINIILATVTHGHINGYIMNLALIILNIYFLQ